MGELKDYEQTCRYLIEIELLEEAPPMPGRMPRYDDEEPLGIQFFRTELEGEDLSGLTLPRTYFCRSSVMRTSFRRSVLSESCLCWNDLVDVDFSETDLTGSDLRASLYDRVSFVGAKLDDADLRQSKFDACRFDGASLNGAVLTHQQKTDMKLSPAQLAAVAWTDDDGDEPEGG